MKSVQGLCSLPTCPERRLVSVRDCGVFLGSHHRLNFCQLLMTRSSCYLEVVEYLMEMETCYMIHLEEVTFTLLIHLVSDCCLEQLLNRCRSRILLPGEADLCRAGMQFLGCFSGKQKSALQQCFCLVNRWRAPCMVISLKCSRHCYLKLWMVVILSTHPWQSPQSLCCSWHM